MSELDTRKKAILHALVLEYVEAAEPVGSSLLVQKYSLGVKSATVRNELSELLDLGYLEQPHTSAGRIPSDLGYRVYVDELSPTATPSSAAKSSVRRLTQDGTALETLLRGTTQLLAVMTRQLGVAMITRNANVTLRTAILSALGPKQAVFVLVMSNGHVENRMIDPPVAIDIHDIGVVNEQLNKELVGKTLVALSRMRPATPGDSPASQLFAHLTQATKSISKDLTRGQVIVEGEEFVVGQPEFSRDRSTGATHLENLFDKTALSEVLQSSATDSIRVTIGKENRAERLWPFSYIRGSVKIGEEEVGVIGIAGPTRMRYDEGLAVVDYTASTLSAALTQFLGQR